MNIDLRSWAAAGGGAALAAMVFTCERSVRLYPWGLVEEAEDRPRRLRMEHSLEHANLVTTLCVTAGGLALALMSAGIVGLFGAHGPLSGARPGPGWPCALAVAAPTLVVTWVVPGLVARYRPEPVVAFWAPLLLRLVPRGLRPVDSQKSETTVEDRKEEAADAEAREIYRSLLRLPNVTASEIMTPRIKMVFVRDSATIAEVLEIAERCGHSRLPVFHETRDQVVGVVHIKDLLKHLKAPDWQAHPMRDLMRKPFFVPETKNVSDLFEEFQRGRIHLGIVLDEYGGTAGLISMEDIIEELLGEIFDEHDREEGSRFRRAGENAFELDALTRVADANESLDLNLPEDEDFDTVGGYVSFGLGRLASPGEAFERDGVRITVLDADARRVKRVRVEILGRRTQ